jgi:PAS domain S-box-containing protein
MKQIDIDLKHLRYWCLTAFVFWTLLLNGSFWIFASNEWHYVEFIGKEIGLTAIRKDYVHQIWNSNHGGVISAGDNKARLINPAQMTREIYQIEQQRGGIQGNISSLQPLEPKNIPGEWEKKALESFELGAKNASELFSKDGSMFMRVMIPAIMDASCLKCHVERDYSVGSIRGGISITLPMDGTIALFAKQFQSSLFYHLMIYLIGLAGMILFYLHTSKQLHKRVIVESKLQAQEQHLRGIVDNISNGIAVYEADEQGTEFFVKSINPAGRRIAQVQEGFADKKATVIFPGLAESGLLAVFQRVVHSGTAEHLSVTPCTKTETDLESTPTPPRCLEFYVYRISTRKIVAVYEDVTLRKKAKAQLLRKTAEWENTFDAIPDIITLQDKEMRIIRANQATFEFFQKSPEQLLGMTCHQLFRGIDVPCPGCPGIMAMHDSKKHCTEMEHKLVGKIYNVCAAPVLNADHNFLYFVYIAHDITDKKKLEEELLQAQKMEAIGTLAGGIAHDFNNILAAILGYAELAKMEMPEDSNAHADIEQVVIAGNRATELVKQILTFSRKSEYRKQPLRIYVLIKEAVKMLRSSLPSSISISADIDENSGLVLADPTNIQQIVFNLCTNAAYAIGGRQGKIDIRLKQVELTAAELTDKTPWLKPGTFIMLSVQDDGSGMDERTLNRIFDPYFTTKEQGAGTGLGLAVTHGVVEDCRGFIEVASELGKGSIFEIFLPVLPEESKEIIEPDHSCPLPNGTEQILFVDDEAAIVHISQSILTALGYTVLAETDSLAALKKFQEAPEDFDLVITDQTMPGMTGSELAKVILRLQPDLPIILCTGYTASFSEKDALALGIRHYAIKPLTAAKLALLVREVLDATKVEAG